MTRFPITATLLACSMAAACSSAPEETPAPKPGLGQVVFQGARLVTGTDVPPIEDGAFIVEGGRFTAVGSRGSVAVPDGAEVVDLRGKTVMPALVDAHSHLGYTDVKRQQTSPEHYTQDNLIEHLRRYAYYGIGATLSLGLDRGELPYILRDQPTADAALFLTAGRGLAPPNAGPLAEFWRDAPYSVATAPEGRAAVRELAVRGVDIVKIWVDDRGGTVAKMPAPVFTSIIDEAHQRSLRVVAHVYYLADAKALLLAGVDGFAHGVRDVEVDDAFVKSMRERPNVFVIANLPDRPPAKRDLEWLGETLPRGQMDQLRQNAVDDPPRPALFEVQARSLAKLAAADVPIALGTDAGTGSPYGWSAHEELADMVAAGLTPAQALIAGTSTAARAAGVDAVLGTLAVGKSADFVVLDGNPLQDIRNTRKIWSVYLRGSEVDRERLGRQFTQEGS